jgi:hypothetical protein
MKTQTLHEIVLQAWWEDAMVYSNYFFDMTATLGTKGQDELAALFAELQMIRTSFEQAEYPNFVMSARQHLLNSMAEVVLSFQAFFEGNTDYARLYMQTAQAELLELQSEVYRLGLPRFPQPISVQ